MSPELIKPCLGKYNKKQALERKCSTCNSLNVCIQQQSTDITKHYIRLENIEDNKIKSKLSEMKQTLIDNNYKTGRYQTVWTMLKVICTDKNITPEQITILDISDYIENANFSEASLQPTISILRKFSKEILQLDNWNLLGKGKQGQKTKMHYVHSEFTDSKLYKDYEKSWTSYTNRRRCKKYSGVFVYQRKFLDYCYNKGVRDFNFNSLKPHIEEFLDSQNQVSPTSYKQIWTALKILFEYAFNYYNFKYDITKPKKAKPRLKPLPDDTELQTLFQYLKTDKDIRWYPLIATVCYSSVRIEQICSLTWDIVDLEKGFFRLSSTKTGDRDKPIINRLIPLFEEYKLKLNKKYPNTEYLFPLNNSNGHLATQMVREKFKELSKKLKIGYYPPNNWRANICITIWIKSGYNYEYARRFMGHDSVKTTERYIRHYREITHEINYEDFIPDHLSDHDINLTF